MTDDHSNPNCPIKIAHGTTTLAFRFQGGIVRLSLRFAKKKKKKNRLILDPG